MKQIIFTFVVVLTSISSFAQIPNANEVQLHLDSAKSFFNKKNFNESINESDKGIALYGKQKDSLYVELLANKALCYNWQKHNDIAIPILKEAIKIYQSFGKEDRLLSNICWYYCKIASAASDKEYYHKCVLLIFKTGYLHQDDYEIYKNSFLAMYGELEISELPTALKNEDDDFRVLFNGFYSSYFEYLKGYVYAKKKRLGYPTVGGRRTDGLIKAIPYLENAIKGLKNLDDLEAKETLMESYSCLADIYESLGQNASAAYQHREILTLLSTYWKKLGYKSPWSLPPNFMHSEMLRFRDYVEQLAKAKQYQSIVDYCNTVLDDKRLLEAGDYCYLTVLETLKDAYRQLNDDDEVKRIENLISSHGIEKKNTSSNQEIASEDAIKLKNTSSNQEITSEDAIKLYNEGQITHTIISQIAHSVSQKRTDFDDFYVLLLDKKEYATIFSIGNSVIEELRSKRPEGIWLSEEDVAARKCTR